MNVSNMVKRLMDKGFTQSQISRMVEARGVKCPQSQVYRILHGRDPSYTLGDAIRRVYMEHCESPLRENAA